MLFISNSGVNTSDGSLRAYSFFAFIATTIVGIYYFLYRWPTLQEVYKLIFGILILVNACSFIYTFSEWGIASSLIIFFILILPIFIYLMIARHKSVSINISESTTENTSDQNFGTLSVKILTSYLLILLVGSGFMDGMNYVSNNVFFLVLLVIPVATGVLSILGLKQKDKNKQIGFIGLTLSAITFIITLIVFMLSGLSD